MAVIFTIPTKKYQNGTTSIASTAIPAGSSSFLVQLDVTNMTLATQHFDAMFNVSYDGGTTWQFLIGAGRDGFVMTDDLGNVVTTAEFSIDMDPTSTQSTTRRIQGTLTISGGPWTMGGTVQAL